MSVSENLVRIYLIFAPTLAISVHEKQ